MGQYFKYKIPINILSPIHIGSNNSYTANEYLFVDDKVYRINIVDFYNSLNDRNKEKFINLIQGDNFSLSDLEYIDEDLLKTFSRYYLISKCNKYPIYNNVEVESAIKSFNQLYIPGSSIKGAIKTALLYEAIHLDQVPILIDKILFNNYHRFINDFFTSSLEDATIFYNILRFLQIDDSSNFNNDSHLHQAVNWHAEIKQKKMYRKGAQTRYVETIPELNTLNTVMTINYDKDFFQELNFNDETEKLLTIKKISESLFSFAKDFINFETKFFSKFQMDDAVKFYEKLKKINDYNKPLIILGGLNGVFAKTIYLKAYKYDQKNNTHFSENYVQLLFGRADDGIFPKSRYLTHSNSKPFGWAQLDFSKYI